MPGITEPQKVEIHLLQRAFSKENGQQKKEFLARLGTLNKFFDRHPEAHIGMDGSKLSASETIFNYAARQLSLNAKFDRFVKCAELNRNQRNELRGAGFTFLATRHGDCFIL